MAPRATDATSGDAVAIVTGGSRGVGREMARKLADRGYAVVIVYIRDQGVAETAVEEILAADGTALAVRADVTDAFDVERLFDETQLRSGVSTWWCTPQSAGPPSSTNRPRSRCAVVARSSTSPVRRRSHPPSAVSCARDITVNGLAPGLEAPGACHDSADLPQLLDRWRRKPGLTADRTDP